MSVPLDRLYNFLHDVCNHRDLIIYGFFPHGSRKITNLAVFLPNNLIDGSDKSWETRYQYVRQNILFLHDQEPLNFDLYSSPDVFESLHPNFQIMQEQDEFITGMVKSLVGKIIQHLNFKIIFGFLLYKIPVLLIHSEQRSSNLQKYQDIDFVGVYWWCHGVIARDWFRYAQHDVLLSKRIPQQDFLIYNRAWSGTREYRLKFAELVVDHDLYSYCKMGFNSEDSVDYRQHQFQNKEFQTQRQDLEQYFFHNTSDSSASADYCTHDYQTTNLEVVLETLFDDDRLHLTEKTLRPIACGHPFILIATQGSLEYLRGYGFKTFHNIIDETYDTIADPAQRLEAILIEMNRIAKLPHDAKQQIYAALRSIAEYNQQRFFSVEWHNQLISEFKQNFDIAIVDYNQRMQSLLTLPTNESVPII
jgi:hypothetical protein